MRTLHRHSRSFQENQNYVYNTGINKAKENKGKQVFCLFQWYATKFTFFGCPGNARCNAILKNILSLTNDQIPRIYQVDLHPGSYKNVPPDNLQSRSRNLSNASSVMAMQSCCITSTPPQQTNRALLSDTHEKHRVKNKREAIESRRVSWMLVQPD